MKFFDYCATQYAIINHEMQLDNLKDTFDLKKQAQTKASQELIEMQRKWFKFWAKVKFVYNFYLCFFTQKWPTMPEVKKPEAPPLKVVADAEERN